MSNRDQPRFVKPTDQQLENAFAQVFARRGKPIGNTRKGRFIDDIRRDMRFILGQMDARVYLNYINTTANNAFAVNYEGCDLIAITSGLTSSLCKFYFAVMGDPGRFVNLGNPNLLNEESHLERIRLYTDVSEYPSPNSVPICQQRAELAFDLIICAHLFIVCHEYAHLIHCHSDLLRDLFSVDSYDEFPATAISPEEGALRRALEMQADAGSVATSLRHWRNIYDEGGAWKGCGLDADDIWSIAIEALFVWFDILRANGPNTSVSTHPQGIVRWFNTFTAATSEAEDLFKLKRLRRLYSLPGKVTVTTELRKWAQDNGVVSGDIEFWEADYLVESQFYRVYEEARRVEQALRPHWAQLKNYQQRRWAGHWLYRHKGKKGADL